MRGDACEPGRVERPGRGIPETLARERAVAIGALRYELAFTIPDDPAQPVQGRVVLRFSLKAPHRIVLDFAQPRDRVRAVCVPANGEWPSTVPMVT